MASKVGMLDAHDDTYQVIADITTPNRQRYAKKHGYDFHEFKFGKLDRTPHWGRILGFQEYLKDHEWLFYCDTDAVILNDRIRLESYLDDNYTILAGPLPHEGHLSTAGLILRNCDWIWGFLNHWWNQTRFIDEPYYAIPGNDHGATSTDGGGKFYEQSAFECLYDTEILVRNRVKRLPRGAFNAIASSAYLYSPGDFLIHFPGVSREDKLSFVKKWVKKTIKV